MAQANDKRRSGSVIGWIQIAAVIGFVVFAALVSFRLANIGGEPAAEDAPEARVTVALAQPERIDHRIEARLTGTVEAQALVNLSPQVGGRVIAVSEAARSGGAFAAGEPLFRLDPRDFEIAIDRAQASLADARSALRQLEADAELTREEFARINPDQPIPPLAALEPQLEAARARVQAARADVRQAELNLERSILAFDFPGRVIDSRIELGQLLAPNQSYGTVYSLDGLELVVPAAPTEIARIEGAQGRSARVRFTGAAQEVTARVVREGAAIADRSRLVSLYLKVDDAAAVDLRPGLFAEVVLEGPQLEGVLALPLRAVGGLETVYVVRDGLIEEVAVEILDRTNGRAIVQPFDFGEGVITTPLPENSVGERAEIIAPRGAGDGPDDNAASAEAT